MFPPEQRQAALRAILSPVTREEIVMTRITATAVRAGLALGALALIVTEAGAVSARVSAACAGDYFAYCSQHPVEGPGVRACMRANGRKLSMGCINALVAAGEVSKAEVQRRAASGR
jgi:hypothetical protein